MISIPPSRLKHGHRKSKLVSAEYRAWRHMRTRCENANHPQFFRYGGRGIQVCNAWLEFENFLADMGLRPSNDHSLDRIDVDRNYEPSNCRWATEKEQQRNRGNNRVFTLNGVTASLAELCEINGCSYKTVHSRIQKGSPIEQAMTVGRIGRNQLIKDGPRIHLDALAVTVERLING